MKLTTWDDAFAPVIAQGREIRVGQQTLGNAVIDVINKGGNLIAEASTGTGKSYATLLPIAVKVLENKAKNQTYRGIVSTETLTLQGQIFFKDLPYIAKLYPGFTYAKLMGRSNYLCLNQAKLNRIGNKSLDRIVEKLSMREDSIGDGEKSDVERVLGKELSKEEWEKITGSATFCSDNGCSVEHCWSSKARKRALAADIVVVNHAVLATDLEMRTNGTSEDGLLGTFEALVVDEGHQLEPVLVSQWTKELTVWELNNMSGAVMKGIDTAQKAATNHSIGRLAQGAMDDVTDVIKNIQNFYSLLVQHAGEEWKGSSSALSMKFLSPGSPQYLVHAMNEYEQDNASRITNATTTLEEVIKYLKAAVEKAEEQGVKGMRDAKKGMRASKDLLSILQIMEKAFQTRDGIINDFGAYGCIVDGWEKRDGTQGMTIRLVPLDVSAKAKFLWHTKTNILVSATLTDLTDGTFKYAKECIGFPAAKEVKVSTPFELATQQLVYVSPAMGQPVQDIRGAQFNMDELVSMIRAARGRSLILFTSRIELDWAAQQLRDMRNSGQFPYTLLTQEKDSDKEKLMEQFKSDTHSVLLATKSFFVGIDVPGEALSLVALAKFPLPRYSVECRQQITHWRKRGFPRWYEREALTILQQAAGRLIRSSGCKGVVALLDYRVSDAGSNVYKMARIGVTALGSPVTLEINDVERFLAPA